METVMEEEEEYSWKEVKLSNLLPVIAEPELERETGERRRGRDVLIAIDHGPNSKHAFDWAIVHFCRLADTVHLVHAVSSLQNQIVYDTTQALTEKLAVEAFEVAMVKTVARVVEGDPGKVICKEAERLKPAAVVMGTRGRSLIKRCKMQRHELSFGEKHFLRVESKLKITATSNYIFFIISSRLEFLIEGKITTEGDSRTEPRWRRVNH